MISWSILEPTEPEFADTTSTTKIICCSGVPLLVSAEADAYKIVQILSTNPNDFLLTAFQPGKIIEQQKYKF